MIVNTPFGAIPIPPRDILDKMICIRCGHTMLYHDFHCFDSPDPHCDIHFKCPYCGYYETHGIAIPIDLIRYLRGSQLHGKTLKGDALITVNRLLGLLNPGDEKLVKEKLRQWGYW